MTELLFLGHAGFLLTRPGMSILIDPWFFPAFAESWFPYPDNRFLLPVVEGRRFDFLYVSHDHEDHFDRRVLHTLDRSVTVLCPGHPSRRLARKFRALGFGNIRVLDHRESINLMADVVATMYLDTGHKEDSGLLLSVDGLEFLDLNDCNPRLSDLPGRVDVLAAQYSGATWYPQCYDYPPAVMADKARAVRRQLIETLVRKCQVTGSRWYLPSAGPPCFLDPTVRSCLASPTNIFSRWVEVAELFESAQPETGALVIEPGDTLRWKQGAPHVVPYRGPRPCDDVTSYAERRRLEWESYYRGEEPRIGAAELEAHVAHLQETNEHLLQGYRRSVRFRVGERTWDVAIGPFEENARLEVAEPSPGYTFVVPPRLLRRILDGELGWEEALLSMRIRLQRDPDVFDSTLMSLLRYGREPLQTLRMRQDAASIETIERDGFRIQRYCPHGGEDLGCARLTDGVLECPRHHWKWQVATGRCLEGGALSLRVERLASPDAAD